MKAEVLEYRDGDVLLRGELAWDEARGGPRPGILVVHEGSGLTEHAKQRARQLAEMGYVALACDMYGNGQVAKDMAEGRKLAMEMRGDLDKLRRRARAGLAALRAQPTVDASRLAAIGFCFGGMVALELARDGAEVAGVVSFHGILRTDRPAQPGVVKAKILACHGAADPIVSAAEVAAFSAELDQAGVDWHLLVLGGAGHGFTNKAVSSMGVAGVAYDAAAERRSWAAMRDFLASLFAPA